MNESTYPADVEAQLRKECSEIIARYPQSRSALGPMLHLIQSVDGYVSPRGVALCSEMLGLSRAEVSAVATFYSQYRRRPNGEYNVGVCTNPLCGVMGGDIIWKTLSEHLGVGHNETTEDGCITLEQLECNAACDYAPVVMVNWEFFDNQTPESALELVDNLQAGKDIQPTRGPKKVHTFKEISRVLAGFEDGHVGEGISAGAPSLLGLSIARQHNWTAPQQETSGSADPTAGTEDVGEAGSSAERQATGKEGGQP
ncbi:MAG: NADH-quinone oxidoreductase subunit NuoE [Bowdeniella nasicola]|nr:NADH-quinone oxidoreductase subunit NuoE [Bowdeniella nasicola]